MFVLVFSFENWLRIKWNIDRKGNWEIVCICINVFINKYYGNVIENIINFLMSFYIFLDLEIFYNDCYYEEDMGIVVEDRVIGIFGYECKKLVRRDKYG